MNYKWLKRSRVILALFFFLFVSLVFLDFRDILNEDGINAVIYLQFVPSLIKFFTIFGLSALGFIITLTLTVFFGRIYCSAICPLGIFQDLISRIGVKVKKNKRYKFRKPNNILRYSLLGITVLSGIFVSIFLVNLLDPYSAYGKIANQLFRPLGIWINNGIADVLESMNIYFLYKKDLNPVHFSSLAIPALILAVIVFMSGKYGRLYCNTICPVGTLLGWLSRISIFRIHLNKSNCTQCGRCSFACKAECISIKEMEVDHSRCVACFNCLTVCEDSAIDFTLKRRLSPVLQDDSANQGRKRFFFTAFAGILAITGFRNIRGSVHEGVKPINKRPTTIPEKKNYAVSPPGSLSINHFTDICTACQLCVSQCPTGVLQPSFSQFGLSSIMQPHMDYNTNYCNYECIKCGEVCPTGAILSITAEEKKILQLGKVQFIKENCVVYTENTACGSCSEHCPTQAVKMVPYKDSLTIPETDNSICVGCGACEHACPVVPYKAIYVDGNPIHLVAEKPEQEKLEQPSTEEDFPF